MSTILSASRGDVDSDIALLTTENDKVVLMFSGARCPPCKKLYPVFNLLAQSMPDIKFVKVDVEEFAQASSDFGITCMPTFLFYCHGHCVGKIEGGSSNALQAACADLNDKRIAPQAGGGGSLLQKYAPKSV